MPELMVRVGLLVLALVFLSAFLFTLVRSRRWRREHGEAAEPPLVDPELTRFGTPFSPTRTRAARLVREGRAADDPATAHVVVLLAERELGTTENPWRSRGGVLLLLAQLQLVLSQLLTLGVGPPVILVTLALLAGFTVGLGALGARGALRRRERTEHALKVNQALAAELDGTPRPREKGPT
ncbi:MULTISPECIES: hypothetical protein [unclassified Nocardiopsis]|uniref:hypothetical protein n=1 Tax=unclassified Nocardiopsis TaxID=2649073 RepID=UPI000A89B87C|nr:MULTISPECIES: hypothetical protein [unclassified Nocardiopsis]MBQ1082231.1 hypothetical protein [Nocardiopsis sp. B62]